MRNLWMIAALACVACKDSGGGSAAPVEPEPQGVDLTIDLSGIWFLYGGSTPGCQSERAMIVSHIPGGVALGAQYDRMDDGSWEKLGGEVELRVRAGDNQIRFFFRAADGTSSVYGGNLNAPRDTITHVERNTQWRLDLKCRRSLGNLTREPFPD